MVTDFHRTHPAKPHPAPVMRLCFRLIENFTEPIHVPGRLYNWEKGIFEQDKRDHLPDAKEIWFDALEEQSEDRKTRSFEGG